MNSYYVKHFDDYHEIETHAKAIKPKHKYHELGCFEAKGHPYHRYFGIFWSSRKPTREAAIVELLKAGFRGDIFKLAGTTLKEHVSGSYYAGAELEDIDLTGFK